MNDRNDRIAYLVKELYSRYHAREIGAEETLDLLEVALNSLLNEE